MLNPGAPFPTATVLVVDDEPDVAAIMRDVLIQAGLTVYVANSKTEAQEQWQRLSQTIDLMIIDMVLGEGGSGSDLAEALAAEKPRLKVILTSGYGEESLPRRAPRLTQYRFLQKPFTIYDLRQMVWEVLTENFNGG